MFIKNIKKISPWVALMIVFIITIFLNYYIQWRCLDSDMASEMVLANLLNKEGNLISKNWYYSTEIRVFCEQIWLKLGLFLSPNNWRIARLIGHSINLAILILSFIFLLYSTSIKEKGIWISIVLLLPFDLWYLLYITYGGFYICHTVALFIMLGLLLRYINSSKKIYLGIIFLFGIFFGLNGIKVLMYFSVPCILSFIIVSIYKYINNNKEIKYYNELIKAVLVSLLSTGIGVAIYLFIICKNYTCFSTFDKSWGNISFGNMLNVIENYLQSLGFIKNDFFSSSIKILSINGLIGAFGILNIIVFITSLILLIKNKYYLNGKNNFLFIFILCAYVSGIFMFSLTKEVSNGSYLLPFIPFSLITIELFIEYLIEQKLNTKYLRLILLVSFLFCSFANNDNYLKNDFNRYKGMQETANWLKENGCKKVIAEFWAGNAIAEYSNGEIEVFVINDYGDNSIYNYLQDKNHKEAPLEDGVYVVVPSKDEYERDLSYLEKNAIIKKNDTDLIVYLIKLDK